MLRPCSEHVATDRQKDAPLGTSVSSSIEWVEESEMGSEAGGTKGGTATEGLALGFFALEAPPLLPGL